VLPFPSHEKRQALSREKLFSKVLLSIQGLTYSCCADILECTRLAQKSTTTKLESICAKFGVRGFACNGKFIIMPLPSRDDDGSQLFDGKIGRLRYFALALSMSSGPISMELVHLCMDFPTNGEHETPKAEEESIVKRAPIVSPLLCGHVLTHIVAAICANCGRERSRSEAMGTAQHFLLNLVPTLGKPPEDTSIDDSMKFIQLGYIARILQTMLGIFHQGLHGDWYARESQILLMVNELSLSNTMSSWQRGCHLLLTAAFSECSVNAQSSVEEDNLSLFYSACEKAKELSVDYICSAGTILQLVQPKSIPLFQEMGTPKKESEGEIDSLLSILGIGNLKTVVDSPLVVTIICNWYQNARAKDLFGLEKDLDVDRRFIINDWPHLHCNNAANPTSQVLQVPRGRLPLLRGLIVHENESMTDQSVNKINSLPISYTDLYATLGSMLPDSELTAICFVCGQVLDAGGKGECTRHTYECGAGCGIFFLLQECVCIAIQQGSAAYITSPYVDSHGETPQYRGRPLNMDDSRYEFLHELWSGHMLREHVIAERSKSARNLMVTNNFY
jgi:hypothetical protein